jgi:hypothetical protein
MTPWRPAALAFAACSWLAVAPFQCASDPDPKKAMEEEPGQALYGLARKFHERGDERARVETLRYIVDRYPSSRFAEMAKQDLAQIEGAKKEE